VKKIATIFVLCSLLIYIGGYHLMYALHKQNIKAEMRQWVSSHKRSELGDRFSFVQNGDTISDPAFEWEETNTEFRYHGELYDVIQIRYDKDKVHIIALKDGKENELDKQLSALDAHRQGKQKAGSVFKFFSVFVSFEGNRLIFPENANQNKIPAGIAQLASLATSIALPPPRC
jgi:hypothetical protein